mgnify:CR=1 FL=1
MRLRRNWAAPQTGRTSRVPSSASSPGCVGGADQGADSRRCGGGGGRGKQRRGRSHTGTPAPQRRELQPLEPAESVLMIAGCQNPRTQTVPTPPTLPKHNPHSQPTSTHTTTHSVMVSSCQWAPAATPPPPASPLCSPHPYGTLPCCTACWSTTAPCRPARQLRGSCSRRARRCGWGGQARARGSRAVEHPGPDTRTGHGVLWRCGRACYALGNTCRSAGCGTAALCAFSGLQKDVGLRALPSLHEAAAKLDPRNTTNPNPNAIPPSSRHTQHSLGRTPTLWTPTCRLWLWGRCAACFGAGVGV